MAKRRVKPTATKVDVEVKSNATTESATITPMTHILDKKNKDIRQHARDALYAKAMNAIETALFCGRPGVCIDIESRGLSRECVEAAGEALHNRLEKWSLEKGLICHAYPKFKSATTTDDGRERMDYHITVEWDCKENLPKPIAAS